MKSLVEEFIPLEAEIAGERGPFTLFALVLRQEMSFVVSTTSSSGDDARPERWDILLAAPWIDPSDKANLNYFVDKIKQRLGPRRLLMLSRVALLPVDAPIVKAFNQAFNVEHGRFEVVNCNLFGLPVARAYVITSQARNPTAVTAPQETPQS